MKKIAASLPKIEASTLAGLSAFAMLPATARAELVGFFTLRRYRSGNVIIAQKQPDEKRVYFVVSGSVRVTVVTPKGQPVGFRDLGPGAMFGEIAAIDEGGRSAEIRANTESLIASVSSDGFRRIMRNYPDVSDYVLKHLTGLIRRLSSRVVSYASLTTKYRVYEEILRHANDIDKKSTEVIIENFPTQDRIAQIIGTRREAVSSEINLLKDAGVIATKRGSGRLVLKDRAKLEQLVLEAGGEVLFN